MSKTVSTRANNSDREPVVSSPLPWVSRTAEEYAILKDANGKPVAMLLDDVSLGHPACKRKIKANSDLICLACNHHEGLLAQLHAIFAACDSLRTLPIPASLAFAITHARSYVSQIKGNEAA